MFSTYSELGNFTYWTRKSMNNLLSYYRLLDARISASEKDLPVIMFGNQYLGISLTLKKKCSNQFGHLPSSLMMSWKERKLNFMEKLEYRTSIINTLKINWFMKNHFSWNFLAEWTLRFFHLIHTIAVWIITAIVSSLCHT